MAECSCRGHTGLTTCTAPHTKYSPIKVGNELVFIVAHSRSEVCNSRISLLGPAEVRLRYENVSHGQHAQPSQLLRGIEDNWREPTGHLGVESNLDTCLDLGDMTETATATHCPIQCAGMCSTCPIQCAVMCTTCPIKCGMCTTCPI